VVCPATRAGDQQQLRDRILAAGGYTGMIRQDTAIAETGRSRRKVVHRTFWTVFRLPLVIGLVSAAGLGFALFGDGVWDALSWLALLLPILVAGFYFLRSRA
jgi:hypothetical protein